ncbi:MAG: TATA-box-binding protein [Nitrosarchaeum sp.]|nr:TATA-box-binding protein [Nitrosarchaeum sp.]
MAFTIPLVCIENVVATATIDQKLDLHEIKRKFPDSGYNPQQFPGAIFKIDLPRTTTLIFRTGNMVCTGAKSEKHAYIALNNVVNLLRSKNIKIKNDANIVIQNVVTAVNLGGKILIEQAASKLPRSMYEPDQFPGLIHRQLNPKTVMLLFASGKLICTGGKSSEQAFNAIHQIHLMLEEKKLISYG